LFPFDRFDKKDKLPTAPKFTKKLRLDAITIFIVLINSLNLIKIKGLSTV
jgi:hypothetical protein